MALVKVKIKNLRSGDEFTAHFNPEEYALNKDINFASQGVPGLSSPVVQFVNGNLRTLEMELLFDTYDTPTLPKQDVRVQTGALLKFLEIDPELHAPPILTVSWASLDFTGVLTRANQRFLMFAEDGTPVRSRITASFSEWVDPEKESKQVTRQTADFTKLHVVLRGETLSSIAGKRYDDPRRWRPLAVANGIDDPRSIEPGQSLLVPSLPYTDPESGEAL
jgi:hypothetical protein